MKQCADLGRLLGSPPFHGWLLEQGTAGGTARACSRGQGEMSRARWCLPARFGTWRSSRPKVRICAYRSTSLIVLRALVNSIWTELAGPHHPASSAGGARSCIRVFAVGGLCPASLRCEKAEGAGWAPIYDEVVPFEAGRAAVNMSGPALYCLGSWWESSELINCHKEVIKW